MQTIVHLGSIAIGRAFDMNVQLSVTPGGIQCWSPTQAWSVSLDLDDRTSTQTELDTLWNFRIDGLRQRLELADVDRMMSNADAFGPSATFFDRSQGALGHRIEIATVDLNGETFVIAADRGAGCIGTYEVSPTQAWAGRTTVHHDSQADVAVVSAMATVATDSGAFVVTASELSGAITVFALSATGGLTPISTLGVADGLPIAAPNGLEVVEGAGGHFIIVSGAGSDSLTALALNDRGGIVFSDQIVDSRDTRFDATVAMDWITREGRVFGAVAGADGGASLIELLPSGRFVIHGTVEDSTVMGLTGLNDVALRITATGIDLTTISATEQTLTRFAMTASGGIVRAQGSLATGGAGDELLIGGAASDVLHGNGGVDVLVDGAGVDTLYGGAGGDLFVFDRDGEVDRIYDFDVEEDRLDLSAWGMLYSIDQLTIRSRSDGALLTFGEELLHIVSYNGQRLLESDFANTIIAPVQHVSVWEPLGSGPGATQGLVLTGSAGADVLVGTAGDDTIHGMDGADVIQFSDGDDVIDGGAGRDLLTAEDATGGVDLALGGTITGVEDLRGSDFSDILSGDDGSNLIEGGAGDDSLMGGNGADTLVGGAGADAFDGGPGIDLVSYAGQTADMRADLSGGQSSTGAAAGDTFVLVENLLGGAGHDTLIGSSLDNILMGESGDDWLEGGVGSDDLQGGSGNDTLIGGAGDDTLIGGVGDDLLIADAETPELYL